MKRKLLVGLVVLACACGKKRPPPKNEFEAFDRDYEGEIKRRVEVAREHGEDIPEAKVDDALAHGWRTVFIGPSGVFVDRKQVATLAELETKRAQIAEQIVANERALAGDWNPSVVLDLDAQSANVAVNALRLFAGREVHLNRRRTPTKDLALATEIICRTAMKTAPTADAEVPKLSVLLAPDRTWVGLSKLNEFQEIPNREQERDLEKLESTLREHKSTDLFRERTDLELAVEAGTARDVLGVIEAACKTGFIDLALLEPNAISARPSL